MAIKRASDAVYDTRYYLVWAPKYRKLILRGDIRDHVEAVFRGIAAANDLEIEALEIAGDHVHIFRNCSISSGKGEPILTFVIPAKAGIQGDFETLLDSGFRRNDLMSQRFLRSYHISGISTSLFDIPGSATTEGTIC